MIGDIDDDGMLVMLMMMILLVIFMIMMMLLMLMMWVMLMMQVMFMMLMMLIMLGMMLMMLIFSDYQYSPVNFLGVNICVLGSLIYTKVRKKYVYKSGSMNFIVFFYITQIFHR